MSLQTALSGLNGAQTGLNTVSNDLSNVSTTAFKSQTSLFADVYPANSANTPGIGVATSSMSTDFTQGNLIPSGNPLNAAIQGSGFFVASQNGQQLYTRDGSFQLSPTGQLVNSTGAAILGYPVTAAGIPAGTLAPITVNTGAVPAKATGTVGLTLSMNSGDSVIPAATPFNATDPTTYNESTSVVSYDSLGNANRIGLYFVQNPAATTSVPSTWSVYAQPQNTSGGNVGTPTLMTSLGFSTTGALTSGSPATLAVNWGNGAAPSSIAFNLTGTTLGAQTFALAGTTNDGYAPGNYSGSSISKSGAVQSTYSNGQTVSSGSLGIANFINQEGLQSISGNLYASSQSSGQPVLDTAGTGQAGTVLGGNLEQSNASSSSLLVSLIQYQQAYQANAAVIQTEQTDGTRLSQL